MYYLIYVSAATERMSDADLRELLRQARQNNERQELTGMLVYKAGMFVQMLEGEQASVRALFEKVLGDPRHHDIVEIEAAESRRRYFPDWSMGFCNMEARGDLPELSRYMDDILASPDLRKDLPRVHKFLKSFARLDGCGEPV